MKIVLSPAKRLDFESDLFVNAYSQPRFLDDSLDIIEDARKLSTSELQGMMKISDELAALNHRRYQDFSTPFTPANARQAVYAFRGDAYYGLDAPTLSDDDMAFAQDHLRILSGLYGLLRPLDLIQP
ncbi:MAG: peroxide stress protein YaaA, partial [Sphingomonadales bacterium]|nr:peroxide stress protein YaaA [Sphingomonadales bacterium]